MKKIKFANHFLPRYFSCKCLFLFIIGISFYKIGFPQIVHPGKRHGREQRPFTGLLQPTTTTPNETLVTMFTTFKVSELRRDMNHNTLRFWASLRPALQPVLFYTPQDDVTFLQKARDLGWLTFEVPRLRHNVPVVKDMFMFVRDQVATRSVFFGYANSDIVFTSRLLDILKYFSKYSWTDSKNADDKKVMLFGNRHDVFVEDLNPFTSPVSEKSVKESKVTLKKGNIFAMDYFIMTHDTFPFENLPDFVVGKAGWDSYMLIMALDLNLRSVDCSQAMTALHQVTSFDTLDRGWLADNPCMNRDLVEPFYWNNGHLKCLKFRLMFLENNFELNPNLDRPKTCDKGKAKSKSCRREVEARRKHFERRAQKVKE